jgi:hypothetical protein
MCILAPKIGTLQMGPRKKKWQFFSKTALRMLIKLKKKTCEDHLPK